MRRKGINKRSLKNAKRKHWRMNRSSVKSQRVETRLKFSLAALLRVQPRKKIVLTKIHMLKNPRGLAPSKKVNTREALLRALWRKLWMISKWYKMQLHRWENQLNKAVQVAQDACLNLQRNMSKMNSCFDHKLLQRKSHPSKLEEIGKLVRRNQSLPRRIIMIQISEWRAKKVWVLWVNLLLDAEHLHQ